MWLLLSAHSVTGAPAAVQEAATGDGSGAVGSAQLQRRSKSLHTKWKPQDRATCQRISPQYNEFVSQLAAVPCRSDLVKLAQQHFSRKHRAVEVGVWRGTFSALNLHTWRGEYYAIDAWQWRPSDNGDKNYKNETQNEVNYEEARANLNANGANDTGRVHQIKSLSADAATSFPDGFFDWIYLDALHTRKAVTADLRAWWPKLRSGGLLSGDDFGDTSDTEYLTVERQAKAHPGVGFRRWPIEDEREGWGVITALRDFCTAECVQLHVTWMHDCYKWPAWYVVKPWSTGER